ncbi:hypothetical protein TraAM80_00899 [Trypanosoma rangeli]|uniref:Uncharacterized protein n=1 Tax=Trypanosoma rangeli TaxID=5698 RepID=A0A422P134_TRYRA|nr:uncharacterized protein TraAM80_00899 [Trypanosoma rangeli]RNF11453.1 hypothetical protein TraAM80_00899 [Trypanosoma rangeli]|eukprot:RNF11453.1 hypothetical protein TraAM80_00899 [Trypanosoma rangeli]
MRNRVAFYRPIPRDVYAGALGELFPAGCRPMRCVNPSTLRHLCGQFGVSSAEAAATMLDADLDINVAVNNIVKRKGFKADFGSFGLVGFEAYAPETFCLVSFALPSFDATHSDDVLDAIHELTLSAEEIPLDVPKGELVKIFLTHWTTEDGTNCKEMMNSLDLTVQCIILLPYGGYSLQVFHILHPSKEGVPNIGTGAAACYLDLRTGIRNRFGFHVERVADSLSEQCTPQDGALWATHSFVSASVLV